MEISKWTHLLGAVSGSKRGPHKLCKTNHVSFWVPAWIPSRKRILPVVFLCSLVFWFCFCFTVLGHMSLFTPALVGTHYQVSFNYTLSIYVPRLQESDFTLWPCGDLSVDNRSIFCWMRLEKNLVLVFCFSVCVSTRLCTTERTAFLKSGPVLCFWITFDL